MIQSVHDPEAGRPAISFPLLPDPPFPVTAVFLDPTLTIVFDRPLVPAIVSVANWAVNVGTVFGAEVVIGGFVELTLIAGGGVTLVTFTPPPFDLVADPDLTAVLAFTDFPVT